MQAFQEQTYIESVGRFTHPSESQDRFFAMLVEHGAFCDESEDAHGKTIFAVSGFLGRENAWRSFELMWKEALADEGIPEFHASKCDGGHGIFHGMSETRRADLQRRFYAITTSVLIWGFASAVQLDAYGMYQARIAAARGELWKPYYLLFQHQIEMMTMALDDGGAPDHERVVFTFDQQQEYQHKGRANNLYTSLASDGAAENMRFVRRLGGLFFGDRRLIVQLQAADILAYENMRYLRECWPDRPQNERWQWRILDSTKRLTGRVFTANELGELCALQGW